MSETGSKKNPLWGLIRLVVIVAIAGLAGKLFYAKHMERMATNHSNRGVELADEGKLNEAIAAFQQALKLDPELQHARIELGKVYGELAREHWEKNEFPATEKYCRKAIQLGFEGNKIYMSLTEACWRQDKYEEASKALQEHEKRHPDDSRIVIMRRCLANKTKLNYGTAVDDSPSSSEDDSP